jgi:hypothetical protein
MGFGILKTLNGFRAERPIHPSECAWTLGHRQAHKRLRYYPEESAANSARCRAVGPAMNPVRPMLS